MSSIFISYRHRDSAAHAGRLYDRLIAEFGTDHVFMDVDSIEPGADFVNVLAQKISACTIMLVVIGPDWLSAGNVDGSSRLMDPADIVRQEVSAGLESRIHLIPLLVDGTRMPDENELPAELSAFARRQAVVISNRHFHRDVTLLINSLREQLAANPENLDLTGDWIAVVQSRSGQRYRIAMTIEQFQKKLFGLVRYPTGEGGILEGEIEGNMLSFKTEHLPQFEQEKATINFHGRISGQEIEFVMQSQDGFTKFIARKKA